MPRTDIPVAMAIGRFSARGAKPEMQVRPEAYAGDANAASAQITRVGR